jgi:hypothetical protein
MISAVSLASVLLLRKPDGNYYMLMYALTFIHLAVEMKDLSGQTVKRGCRTLTPLIACGLLLCLLTSWSWTLGLTPIEMKNGIIYDHQARNQTSLEQIGLGEISRKLENEGGKSRVMVISNEGPWLLSIPAIAESWIDLSYWGNRELSTSAQGLYDYYNAVNMDYVILERLCVENPQAADMVSNLLTLSQDGYLHINMDEGRYMLLRFDASGTTVDGQLCDYFAEINQ